MIDNMYTIRERVLQEGFSIESVLYPCMGENYSVGLSKGIRIALENNKDMRKAVDDSLMRFISQDYNDMYAPGEPPLKGNAYGCYPSPYGSSADGPLAGAIMIHEEHTQNYNYIIYFQFER